MKKLLLSLAFVAFLNINVEAQISFESSEGYELGQINNQNEWTLLNASATNVMTSSLATVSSNRASDGNWSLRLANDGGNWNYFAGVLSPEFEGFDDTYDVEFSFYPESNGDSDHLFQIFDLNDANAFVTVVALRFTWQEKILLFDGEANVEIAASYPDEVWHEVKISRNSENHMVYVNGTLLHTMPNYGTGSAMKFLGIRYDNYGSGFNVDNLRVTDPLSTPSFEKNQLKHFVDANGLNLSAEALISNVAIFNVSGQQLINQTLNASTGTINTNSLSNGVYFAQVSIDGTTTTVKFVK